MKALLNKIVFFVLFISTLQASEDVGRFVLYREDGSELQGYFSAPKLKKNYPIAILVQGSYSHQCTTQSVLPFHSLLAPLFNNIHVGLCSIEKRGVNDKEFDPAIFHEYNTIKNRINDYQNTLIPALETGLIENWNGQLILIGTSEGGFIAPELGIKNPNTCAVMIFAGAGAWKFEDEIINLIQTNTVPDVPTDEKAIRHQFQVMRKDPTPLKFWLNQTYRYWADALDRSSKEDVLNLNVPLLLVIGSEDPFILSSDDLWDLIVKKKKFNASYYRYEGIGHMLMDKKYNVFEDAILWLQKTLN